MKKMSAPSFPDHDKVLTHDEAVNAILTSIALEETALSHIINAEGEKIQFALEHAKKNGCTDMETVLKVNESTASMLAQIAEIEIVLTNKLSKILKCDPCEAAPAPCPPEKDCPQKPFRPCED
jgi:hypothetical protein